MIPMNTDTPQSAPDRSAAYAKYSAECAAIDAAHYAACAPHDAARIAARFAAMCKYHADIAALDAANAALDAAGRKFNAACARPALTTAARTGYDAEIAQ